MSTNPGSGPEDVPQDGPSPAAAQNPPDPPTPRRPPAWWFTAAVFGVGVVVGILVVGLVNVGTPGFGTAAGSDGTLEPGAPSGSVQVAAEARVNAACLRVINEAQDVYGALAGLDEAVDDVDLQQLDDIVRRLQPIEPRLERDLRACEVSASSPDDPTATSSAVVPRPSASPT